MRLLLTLSIALALTGCRSNIHNDADINAALEIADSGDSLSSTQYMQILDGLDAIVDEVCARARCVLDSGYRKKEVRQRLRSDTIYQRLCRQSGILDSLVLLYIYGDGSDFRIRERYKEILSDFGHRAESLGLQSNLL